jgi:hypothetical protein
VSWDVAALQGGETSAPWREVATPDSSAVGVGASIFIHMENERVDGNSLSLHALRGYRTWPWGRVFPGFRRQTPECAMERL